MEIGVQGEIFGPKPAPWSSVVIKKIFQSKIFDLLMNDKTAEVITPSVLRTSTRSLKIVLSF